MTPEMTILPSCGMFVCACLWCCVCLCARMYVLLLHMCVCVHARVCCCVWVCYCVCTCMLLCACVVRAVAEAGIFFWCGGVYEGENHVWYNFERTYYNTGCILLRCVCCCVCVCCWCVRVCCYLWVCCVCVCVCASCVRAAVCVLCVLLPSHWCCVRVLLPRTHTYHMRGKRIFSVVI